MLQVNRHTGETLPKLVTGAVLIWLVVGPLVFIVLAGSGLIDDQFLRPWHKFAADRQLPTVIKNTLVLALCVTAAATTIGTLLALAMERTHMRCAGLVDKLILIPIMVSPLVGAVAWVTLGRPQTGFLNMIWRDLSGSGKPLFSIYSFAGVAFVISLHVIPYVYVNARGALQHVDGSMEEAALVLGAGTLHTWRRVTLPLVFPATLSSALLVFVLTLETFSVVGLLGGPAGFITLPFNIYLAINLPPGDWHFAALQGVLLIFMTAVLMAGYWWIVGASGKYSTVGGKGFRPTNKVAGGTSLALAAVAWIYIVVAVALPFLALALQSLLAFATTRIDDMVFTLRNWSRLMNLPAFHSAFINTAVIGATAATLAVGISLFVAHLAVFERMRRLDWLSSLPLAFPGIVLGMALIFMYSPTPIYGTIWILILAYTTQFLPFASRSLSAPMMQVERGMDEAGKTLGAYMIRRIFRITAPMIRVAAMGSWIIAFTRSIRELNIAIFLSTPATVVLPVLIWGYMEQGVFSLAATLSIVQVAVVVTVIHLAQGVGRKLQQTGMTNAALAQQL